MLPPSLIKLIHKLRILPGVGQKSAQRYALHLVEKHRSQALELGESIVSALKELQKCSECGALQEMHHVCHLCSHPSRDKSVIMIVPSLFDIIHFESLKFYNGLYHVIGGQLSPIDGIGPDNLHLHNLRERCLNVTEIILALSHTLEGESTAYYIAQLLKNSSCKITRLAAGIPVGGDLEHIDLHTLTLALNGRQPYEH